MLLLGPLLAKLLVMVLLPAQLLARLLVMVMLFALLLARLLFVVMLLALVLLTRLLVLVLLLAHLLARLVPAGWLLIDVVVNVNVLGAAVVALCCRFLVVIRQLFVISLILVRFVVGVVLDIVVVVLVGLCAAVVVVVLLVAAAAMAVTVRLGLAIIITITGMAVAAGEVVLRLLGLAPSMVGVLLAASIAAAAAAVAAATATATAIFDGPAGIRLFATLVIVVRCIAGSLVWCVCNAHVVAVTVAEMLMLVGVLVFILAPVPWHVTAAAAILVAAAHVVVAAFVVVIILVAAARLISLAAGPLVSPVLLVALVNTAWTPVARPEWSVWCVMIFVVIGAMAAPVCVVALRAVRCCVYALQVTELLRLLLLVLLAAHTVTKGNGLLQLLAVTGVHMHGVVAHDDAAWAGGTVDVGWPAVLLRLGRHPVMELHDVGWLDFLSAVSGVEG